MGNTSGADDIMDYDAARAVELLRIGSGIPDASFREGQEEAIRSIVEGAGRLLVVQKTGWGKSFVYFIATRLLREGGMGPALLVSPLLSLMRNQIAAAERMGVRASTINSDNQDRWDEIEGAIRREEVDILLISPERLANERFRSGVLGHVADRIALLVIDEAHCISDWGHDFRPNYRLLERIVKTLPRNLRLLATTATANDRVMKDLATVLGPGLEVSRGDLHRPSLVLQTIGLPSQAERLAWLAEHVAALPGHGIIYALTVRDANQVAEWLQSRGLEVEPYTGKTGDRRPELEQALIDNEVKALVATTALGMGYDKPDLSFVIHYQSPGSVVAYYQQVGRAGRALDAAYGVLLSGDEETDITDFFIESAFPTQEDVKRVLDALEEAPEGLSIPQLLGKINVSGGRVRKTIALLSLESPAPIAKQGTRWQLTAAELGDAFWERAERLTALRREEQAQMQEYVSLTSGHMEFLIRALDGSPGDMSAPDLPPLPSVPDPELVQAAIVFLRRTNLPIEPRRQWVSGGMSRYAVSGRIDRSLQAQPGKALCVLGDAGWGTAVRQGTCSDGPFSDDLVSACVKLVHEWKPSPAPTWVTCVPSLRHPGRVPEFAERLAKALGLPFHAALDRTEDRQEQKAMANSAQQARNLDGAFALNTGASNGRVSDGDTNGTDNEGSLPDGPVLLIDDTVDSRWTLTVATWLLRKHGSGVVWPLVLAQAGSGG
jgi:ATP-dependent DNA helicase RecQ